ncbi:hypothetical protein ACWGIP_23055, partial [Streptomyces sp. NPDC054838]
MPDDGLLVRPYVAAPGRPSPAPDGPTWPEDAAPPVRAPQPVPGAAPSGAPGRRRRPRTPAVLALLALACAGGLVLLLSGPDPQPRRAGAPPGLTRPALPARSPDTGPAAPSAAPPRPKASASPPGTTATPSAPS